MVFYRVFFSSNVHDKHTNICFVLLLLYFNPSWTAWGFLCLLTEKGFLKGLFEILVDLEQMFVIIALFLAGRAWVKQYQYSSDTFHR